MDFLTRVRSALHLETGKRVDRLPLELQPAIARAMGFTDEPRLIAEDGLMRAVFENARTVQWIAGNVLARAADGTRMPADEAVPFGDLDEALEALAAVAACGRAARSRTARLGRGDARAGRDHVERPDPRGVHAASFARDRRASRCSTPSIDSICSGGSSLRGTTFGAVRSAIPTIASPSTPI